MQLNRTAFFLFRSRFLILLFATMSVLLFVRCQKFIPPENDKNTSKWSEDESHYNGYNCMNCHYTEGRGEGWFTVAGTVEGNYDQGKVNIHESFGGPVIRSIEIDQLGNFYTTDDIDVLSGLYYSIEDASGNVKSMQDKIYHGQCNLCHGVDQPALNL